MIWLFLAAAVICFTLLALTRMYLDIRRQELTHVRLMQSDQHSYDKYVRITRQEALNDVAELMTKMQLKQLPEARTYDSYDALPTQGTHTHSPTPEADFDMITNPDKFVAEARYHPSSTPPRMGMIQYKNAWLDPRLLSDAELARLLAAAERKRERERKPW